MYPIVFVDHDSSDFLKVHNEEGKIRNVYAVNLVLTRGPAPWCKDQMYDHFVRNLLTNMSAPGDECHEKFWSKDTNFIDH